MTDKELLKNAAKAAEVFITPEKFATECSDEWDDGWNPRYDKEANSIWGYQTIYSYSGELSGWGELEWNPLTDDGDALRLAVKLGLVFDAQGDKTFCGTTQYDAIEHHKGDPYAATRRAIVRAAAEIGKNK